MPRIEPGLAFSLPCDDVVAVGLMTHHLPRLGHLIWMAEPTFDEPPTSDAVQEIDAWRWPTLFPLGAAIRRKIVTPLLVVPVPLELREIPIMRSGNKSRGWRTMRLDTNGAELLTTAPDPSMPIYHVVNDTLLKHQIESGWRPEDLW